QQPLDEAMGKMHLHNRLVESLRRIEDQGAYVRVAPPFKIPFSILWWCAQRIESGRPRRIASCARFEVRQHVPALTIATDSLSAHEFERAGECIAEHVRVESDAALGLLKLALTGGNILSKLLVAFANDFEFLLGGGVPLFVFERFNFRGELVRRIAA